MEIGSRALLGQETGLGKQMAEGLQGLNSQLATTPSRADPKEVSATAQGIFSLQPSLEVSLISL